jgi:hypothetical protein
MTILNIKQVAQNVQKFYLSGNQTGTINVTLNAPCNENLTVNVTRLSTFQATLADTYATINLYLSNNHKLTYNNIHYVVNNVKSRQSIINHINGHHFEKYLCGNSYTGKYDT